MKIEKVNINDLISPSYNPRTITDTAMESLKTSINEFGYITPIIVNRYNNHVVGGNQRLVALKQLGYNEVEVIFIDEPDINKEKAINIRLNKLSGTWDTPKLNKALEEIQLSGFDVTLTGFNEVHLSENIFINDFQQDTPFNNITDYSNKNQTDIFENNETETNNDDFIIPDDEPEYDETIADDIETITCPRCGYELPKH